MIPKETFFKKSFPPSADEDKTNLCSEPSVEHTFIVEVSMKQCHHPEREQRLNDHIKNIENQQWKWSHEGGNLVPTWTVDAHLRQCPDRSRCVCLCVCVFAPFHSLPYLQCSWHISVVKGADTFQYKIFTFTFAYYHHHHQFPFF